MKIRILLLILCLLFAMGSLCGCINEQESADMERQCRIMLDALIAGDADAAWAVFDTQYCAREDFDRFFANVEADFAGIESYEIKANGFETAITNGIRFVTLDYAFIVDENVVGYISVEKIGDSAKLSGCNIEWLENAVSTKTVSGILAVVIALLIGFGLIVTVVIIVVVVFLRKRHADARKAQEAMRTQELQGVFDNINKDE